MSAGAGEPRGASVGSVLVPITLEIRSGHQSITEHFSWNVFEQSITMHDLAENLVTDHRLPQSLVAPITASIYAQVERFLEQNTLCLPNYPCIHRLNLEVRLCDVLLRDQLDWDISDETNSAEAYAMQLCREMGITVPHFAEALAEALREQIYRARLSPLGATLLRQKNPLPLRTVCGCSPTVRPDPTRPWAGCKAGRAPTRVSSGRPTKAPSQWDGPLAATRAARLPLGLLRVREGATRPAPGANPSCPQ
ncbi:putative SWI/SNF-related matrix-associated actin-dependent regulator [Paratrimastix pyriformis]|uniref:SWI/SNF-related matrix-associated actin-dependent regulator n=1 Tax=Paratrimastix pyriformis TaxID=342808 RepID=A0ABQ8URB0_9EUKA|nr:putative SWI/SNF-related matrix-associated actin-dependent regulator [Paratrimastix pyriformis]